MIPQSKAASFYYKELPDRRHRTGDIWTGFPSFDLFPGLVSSVSAIVITPACDLFNDKTHTITYLPILTIRELLASDVGYDIIRASIQSVLKDHQQLELAEALDRGEILDDTTVELLEDLESSTTNWRAEARDRYLAGVRALRCYRRGHLDAARYAQKALSKKEWLRVRDGLVKNSFADDLHFLPPEQPVYEFSAVREPSVVLFRYPMTIQRRELDRASNAAGSRTGTTLFPVTPLKVVRLEREFLSDLLTRFARLFVRLGSTNFTSEAIAAFAARIEEGR